jgi:cell division protease FtsH
MENRAPQEPARKPEPPRRANGSASAPTPPWVWVVIIAIIGLIIYMYKPDKGVIPYSWFLDQIEANNIEWVHFQGTEIRGELRGPTKYVRNERDRPTEVEEIRAFKTNFPSEFQIEPVVERLRSLKSSDAKIKEPRIEVEQTQGPNSILLFTFLLPTLLFIGLIYFMMRRARDQFDGGILGSFVKSPARRHDKSKQRTTFEEVAGLENAKYELEEIVEFLKNPEKYQRLGGRIPKGVLLNGPPGTGKTLLARAVAGEAGVPFFSISGSEFIQMFVGVGASRVRDMFKTAKENSPCILFIDEIDAVGRIRGAGLGGGHDEREQTLNQILTEMDGFTPSETVIVLAATNRPDVLDPALLRPGRFDRHVTVDLPTKKGRLEILKVHTRKVPLGPDVDLPSIAGRTVGMSGADLANLVNEAALLATRQNRDFVTESDFEASVDKVLMGAKREEIMSEKEKKATAIHEIGHMLVSWFIPEADPVHKVTIIPRGRALGVTQYLPAEDRVSYYERDLRAMLSWILGGRAAERLVLEDLSAGVADDLKKATRIARMMVTQCGMSDKVGPVYYRETEEHPFLGREMADRRDHSEHTAQVIDQEVGRILREEEERAYRILVEHRGELERLSATLLEREVLTYPEIEEMIGKRPVVASDGSGNGLLTGPGPFRDQAE